MRIPRLLIAALLALAPSLVLAQGAPAPIRLPKGSTGPADGLTVGGTALPSVLGAKAPLVSPIFSGTVTAPGVSLSGPGLAGPIDNGTVGGTAIPTLLGAKAPIANPTFSGLVTAPAASVSGTLAAGRVTGDGSAVEAIAAGATAKRSLADFFATTTNIRDYLPTGTTNFCNVQRVKNGYTISAGSSTLKVADTIFLASDVGKRIIVPGAGAVGTTAFVSSIPITSPGAYTAPPTGTLSGGGGSGSVVGLVFGIQSPSIASGGTGYAVGNVLRLQGQYAPNATSGPALITVTSVGAGGAITGISLTNPGNYWQSFPGTSGVPLSDGAGSGATINVASYGLVNVLVSPGSGYTSAPTLTLSGGTSTAAATFGTTVIKYPVAPLAATITGWTDGRTVTLSAAASTSLSVSAQTITFGHDDGPTIAAAMGAVPAGGTLFIPPLGQGPFGPRACGLASTLTKPADRAFTIRGSNRATSRIIALAPMTSLLAIDDSTILGYPHAVRGSELVDFQLDGSAVTNYVLDIRSAQGYYVSGIDAVNATLGANIAVGRTGSAAENYLTGIYGANDMELYSTPGQLPRSNVYSASSDNKFSASYLINSTYAGLEDVSSNSQFSQMHAYPHPISGLAPYGYVMGGYGTITGSTADGALTAGYLVTGYNNIVSGNLAQFTPVGVQIASGVGNVVVTATTMLTNIPANVVQQLGTANPSTVVANNAGASYMTQKPIRYGIGQTNSPTIYGNIGDYNDIQGAGSFAVGSGLTDKQRTGCSYQGFGFGNYLGDAQLAHCNMRGSGTSGTVDLLAGGAGSSRNPANIINLRTDIPVALFARVRVNAICSSGDTAAWTTQFNVTANKSTASIAFVDASGANNAPAFTKVSGTAGASGWAPTASIDAGRSGVVLQGTGSACAGGKTVYWNAEVETVETASGLN